MVFVPPKDRVLERSTTAGSGPWEMGGAVDASYRAFADFMSVGDTTVGCVVEPGTAFASGILQLTDDSSGNPELTLISTDESHGTFSTGTKEIFMGLPASRSLAFDGAQTFTDALKWQARANLGGVFGNGFVNAFRNPTFQINQRGASGSTSSSSGVYTSDGWILGSDGSHSLTWATVWGNIAGARGGNFLQLQPASGSTDTFIKQRIESYVVASVLAGRFLNSTPNITVQIAFSNGGGGSVTPTLTVKHATAQDNFGTMTTDVNAVSLGTVGGSTTILCYTFAWVNGMENGLEITFDFPSLGSGGASYLFAADIRSDPGASIGINTSPPPAELRAISTETTFCQRYYEALYADSASISVVGTIYAFSGTPSGYYAKWSFHTPKRTNSGSYSSLSSSWTGTTPTVYVGTDDVQFVAGNSFQLGSTANAAALSVSCEL